MTDSTPATTATVPADYAATATTTEWWFPPVARAIGTATKDAP